MEESEIFHKEFLNIKEKKLLFHQQEFERLDYEMDEEKHRIEALQKSTKEISTLDSFDEVHKVVGDLKMIQHFSGTCEKTFKGHTDGINSIIELKDGNIASASNDNTIRIWNFNGDCIKILYGHLDSVFCLIETKDGRIVSGSSDNTIKIWKDYYCIKTYFDDKAIYSLIEFNENILSVSKYETYNWDKKIYLDDDKVRCLLETKDNYLLSGGNSGLIKVWDNNNKEIETIMCDSQGICELQETKEGNIITASFYGNIKIWDFENWSCLASFKTNNEISSLLYINHLYSNIFIGTKDGKINVFDDEGIFLKSVKAHSKSVTCLIESKRGYIISCSNNNRTIKIWK